MEAVRNELHHGIRLLVVGVVTGISVTVLYQNITGLHAGRAQPLSALTPTHAQPQPQAAVFGHSLPAFAEAAVLPSASTATAVPTEMTSGLRLLDVPALPVLPAPKPRNIISTAVVGAKAGKDEPSGVNIERINPIEQEDDDDGTGVHVQLRASGKTSSAPSAPAQGIAVPSLGKPPAPKVAAPQSIEPSPEPEKPEPDQAHRLSVSPAQTSTSTAPQKAQAGSPAPSFTIVRQGSDGVLIRIGNQVRHLPQGSALPDGSQAPPSHTSDKQP